MSAAGIHATLDAAVPITAPNDYDARLERIGTGRCVLIGEASHGTHEFYVERARISRRLIEDAGFNAVAVEADWPAASGSTASSAARARIAPRPTRSATSCASRAGYGATRSSRPSPCGCARTTSTPLTRVQPRAPGAIP